MGSPELAQYADFYADMTHRLALTDNRLLGRDISIGVTYRGPQELGRTVEIYATALSDMHRELHSFYVVGDTVVVELHLQGMHKGPLELPDETHAATGKRMNARCCEVFRLRNGKTQSFNGYPSGTLIEKQLGLASERAGRSERQAV